MSEPPVTMPPWEQLEALVDQQDAARLRACIDTLSSGELARALSRLDQEHQSAVLTMLPPEVAAVVLDALHHSQAADMIEELSAGQAAAIIDELPSDEQADVLGELDEEDAEAILEQLDPEEREEIRRLTTYGPDTAGGLMITEYLAYSEHMRVDQVVQDLRAQAREYASYDVQYVYVVSGEQEQLRGVVRLQNLMLAPDSAPMSSLMKPVNSVEIVADLDQLKEFFDRHNFYGAPVVDERGQLVGVVRRADVEEALDERADKTLMRFGGIIGGEELRMMPLSSRSLRRLAYLFPTLLLALMAVSIIAVFESTVERVPAVAIFLPLVAGLCGSSGNQALAVSIRELSLGLAQPADWVRVFMKEIGLGLIMGLALGVAVFGVAWLMRRNTSLALAVGGAIPITIMVAVTIGGITPLLLRGLKIDPAMASGPIVTTVVDLTGFFIVLVGTALLI